MKPFFLLLLLALTVFPSFTFADAEHLNANTPTETTTASDVEMKEVEEEDPTQTIRYRSIKFSGKFHPVMVHFPIAFLLAAFLMQWIFVFTRKKQIPPIVTTMLWMGTLGAIAAAALGWAYAYDSMYFGEEDIQLLKLHRWIGTGTAVAAVITLILKRFLKLPTIFALLLSILAALVGAAGHYGGSLTYGADNFSDF